MRYLTRPARPNPRSAPPGTPGAVPASDRRTADRRAFSGALTAVARVSSRTPLRPGGGERSERSETRALSCLFDFAGSAKEGERRGPGASFAFFRQVGEPVSTGQWASFASFASFAAPAVCAAAIGRCPATEAEVIPQIPQVPLHGSYLRRCLRHRRNPIPQDPATGPTDTATLRYLRYQLTRLEGLIPQPRSCCSPWSKSHLRYLRYLRYQFWVWLWGTLSDQGTDGPGPRTEMPPPGMARGHLIHHASPGPQRRSCDPSRGRRTGGTGPGRQGESLSASLTLSLGLSCTREPTAVRERPGRATRNGPQTGFSARRVPSLPDRAGAPTDCCARAPPAGEARRIWRVLSNRLSGRLSACDQHRRRFREAERPERHPRDGPLRARKRTHGYPLGVSPGRYGGRESIGEEPTGQ